jgi:hypothetical protein
VAQDPSNAERAIVEAYEQGLGPRAAARLSAAEIRDAAFVAAARIDAELAHMQRTGALKSVNQAYRKYRLETSARGERVMRYADWMQRYRAGLVREIAANLR